MKIALDLYHENFVSVRIYLVFFFVENKNLPCLYEHIYMKSNTHSRMLEKSNNQI
jgi:hypothetical protein